jgi:hypothetical protein
VDGRNHRNAVLIVLLVASFASGERVEAQSYARALFQQGVEALRDGRYPDAEAAFTASYAAEPHAATLCNLALAYERWGGHTPQAIDAYDRCASEDRTGEYADHARERSSTLRASIASAQPPPPVPTMMPAAYPTAVTAYPTTSYNTYDPGYTTTYGWLAGGIVTSVLGVGAIITGFILAADAYAIDEELYSVYPNLMIPETIGGQPNPDVDLLDRAKLESGLAVGMWIGGGVVTALGAFLIGLHLAQPAARPPSYPAASVGPNGASLRFSF